MDKPTLPMTSSGVSTLNLDTKIICAKKNPKNALHHHHVINLDYTRLARQGLMTNPLGWKRNDGYRKSALDYATLWRAFRNFF